MVSEKLFENIPASPDDVLIAPIASISLSALRSGNQTTARDLLEACQKLGFFLLDLGGDELGDTLVTEIN